MEAGQEKVNNSINTSYIDLENIIRLVLKKL